MSECELCQCMRSLNFADLTNHYRSCCCSVIQDGAIFGGGLSIKFTNIAYLDAVGAEGDDSFFVLSTDPSVLVTLYGGLGSDSFIVTPRQPPSVVSKNLRGHRGIIEHHISSTSDPDYDGLLIRGVQVDVLDNDFGFISVADQKKGFHLMSEDSTGSFSFKVFPTRVPSSDVVVEVVAPAARDTKRFVSLNGDAEGLLRLTFMAGSMEPEEIVVEYNPEVLNLTVTEINLMLKMLVVTDGDLTKDPLFLAAEQSLLPVDIKLMPSKWSTTGAKAVTIDERPGGTVVAEGPDGFNSTYDVYVRPCSLLDDIKIRLVESVPNQVVLNVNELTKADFDTVDCKATVEVSAFDDTLGEGDRFVNIQHNVTNMNDEPILLTDGSPLLSTSVLVQVFDSDTAGVIIEETNRITATAEIREADKAVAGLNATLYEDEYSIRLTKQPAGDVAIALDSLALKADNRADAPALVQVSVNESNLVFTQDNWHTPQVIRVAAIDDNEQEGVDFLHFASQPSNLGLIQGPVRISGGDSPFVPALADPIMLPNETNPENLTLPCEIDTSMYFVYEANQTDSVIFNNLDVRGDLPSYGTLLRDNFVGMSMSSDVLVFGDGPFSGVLYDQVELITFNLGDGIDVITIESTSEAIHELNMAGEDDNVTVKGSSGPLLINGEGGNDSFLVASDEFTMNLVQALVSFDGGDNEQDQLLVDNSGDTGTDDVVNVTRLFVEFYSMEPPILDKFDNESNPVLPYESFVITLRGATGGTFDISLDDPITNRTKDDLVKTFNYPTTADILKEQINTLLLPDSSSCGRRGDSNCSPSVFVYQRGSPTDESQTYVIFFVGQRLNSDVVLHLDTTNLLGIAEEKFLNKTNDVLLKNSDIAYTNIDFLHVKMGHTDTVVNVRGTSATSSTYITTQGGDDRFFISSDANENASTAATQDILYGELSYFERELHLFPNEGRHRLLMSDSFSTVARGVDSGNFAELTSSSLTNMSDGIAPIYFDSDGFDEVVLWLGEFDDNFVISSIPRSTYPRRTTTTIHGGNGTDNMLVNLDHAQNEGSVFVANGQGGDDVIDASLSSFSVILIGDGGSDVLIGGSGLDILIGDYGRVYWIDEDDIQVARAGGGGYGDYTDGVVRNVSTIIAAYPPFETSDTNNFDSGNDYLVGNEARDIIFGCGGERDELYGNNGSDFLFGDFGALVFDETASNLLGPQHITSLNCTIGGGLNVLEG